MLKIYYDLNFLEKEGCDIPFLFPIIDIDVNVRLSYYHEEQVKERIKLGKEQIKRIDSIKNCDYVVFPKNYNLKYLKEIKKQCSEAQKYKKKVIVFYMSDVENQLPHIDNLTLFRSSINNNNPENEFPMPGFPEDLMKYYKDPYKGIDIKKPSVGYVGYYGYNNFSSKIKYYIHKTLMYVFRFFPINCLLYLFFNYIYLNEKLYNSLSVIGTGWVCRKRTIDVLLKEKRIDFNFIRRDKGLGIYEKGSYREQYINNMINSDFPLVIRGFGNFSFRLSEVMSLGKIPLFIDTDCKLLFEDKIDYKNLFVWVPYKDIKNLYIYINKYISKNKDHFADIQKQIRAIYKKYYTLSGYYCEIINNIL